MATYQPAKRATAWVGYISLVSQADTKLLKSSATIAAGDFKVSKDGGALANLTTLPAVTPAASVMIKIDLSATEMTADNVTIVCIDAAGAEWCDFSFNLQPSARQIDDLAYPATSGRSMVVDAAGLVDANAVKVGPTGSGTAQTAGDVAALVTTVDTVVDAILVDTGTTLDARIPAALVSGRMDSSTGAMAANVMTAAAAAADLTTELQSGLATAAALATVDGIVDDILVDTATTLQGELDGIQATLGVAGAGLTAVVWNADWDAQVQSEVADALAVYDPPTNAEMEARTIAAATYATATNLATANTNISALITTVGVAGAGLTGIVWNANWDAEVQSEVADALIATSLTESYRANGAAGTLPQVLYEVLGLLGEKAVVGTTLTINKLDHVTGAATYTLDDAVNATSITRAA